jgi:hypothetical protein
MKISIALLLNEFVCGAIKGSLGECKRKISGESEDKFPLRLAPMRDPPLPQAGEDLQTTFLARLGEKEIL